MARKQHQPLYLAPGEAETLKELAASLDITNQRGQHSVGALCGWLANVADNAWPETIAALKVAGECSVGGDWDEMIEAIRPQWPNE